MIKWEYKVETTKVGGAMQRNLDKLTEGWLDTLGSDGWELVSIPTLSIIHGATSDVAYLIFKRPVKGAQESIQ